MLSLWLEHFTSVLPPSHRSVCDPDLHSESSTHSRNLCLSAACRSPPQPTSHSCTPPGPSHTCNHQDSCLCAWLISLHTTSSSFIHRHKRQHFLLHPISCAYHVFWVHSLPRTSVLLPHLGFRGQCCGEHGAPRRLLTQIPSPWVNAQHWTADHVQALFLIS